MADEIDTKTAIELFASQSSAKKAKNMLKEYELPYERFVTVDKDGNENGLQSFLEDVLFLVSGIIRNGLMRLGTFQLSDIFYNTVGGMLGGLMYCGTMKARKCL